MLTFPRVLCMWRLSRCPGTVWQRTFWEWSPMTARGLLPPYGFGWRGLGPGTRLEEVVAGGALSSSFRLFLCSCAAGRLESGLLFNQLHKCCRTTFPQSSSICAEHLFLRSPLVVLCFAGVRAKPNTHSLKITFGCDSSIIYLGANIVW